MVNQRNPRLRQLWKWLRPRAIPGLLLIGGVALAVVVAYRSQQEVPPTRTEAAFLVLSSSALNFAAGIGFSRIGRADPTLARSAVRRLLNIGNGIGACLRDLAEVTGKPESDGNTSAQVSVGRLEQIAPDVVAAIQDWNEVHPEALREVLEEVTALEERVSPANG